MRLLEQQTMEIIRFSTALKLDDTVSLSLVYLPCSDSGVVAVEPEKSVSPIHLLTYCFVIHGDGFFWTLTVLTGACWSKTSDNRMLKASSLSSGSL
jgi:hypothetical protein